MPELATLTCSCQQSLVISSGDVQGLQAAQEPETQPPLGLSMIVKNEADYIVQTLLSVKPHIDYWTVVDTGASCTAG